MLGAGSARKVDFLLPMRRCLAARTFYPVCEYSQPMGCSTRTLARRALPLVLAIGAWLAAPGGAAAMPVIAVGGDGAGAAGAPLRVPGRGPLRAPTGASASSLRVLDSSSVTTRTNGKIVGIDPREGNYTCSGTALNTPSRSIVLTAGHCVVLNGAAGKRISFVPAYDHGLRPFGSFAVRSVYVMPQWLAGENPDFDLAALRVEPNGLGMLTDVVGARGFATLRSRSSGFQIFGYPAAALKGEEMRSCRAHGLGSDPLTFPLEGPPTMPGTCDMAAGSSGGAWILDGTYVNGVTSYGYANRPGRLYSPYFGSAVAAFLRSLP
jgi:V8-like Glu-specific endopeptidase